MSVRMLGATCLALAVSWPAAALAQGPQLTADKSAEKIAVTGCLAKAPSGGNNTNPSGTASQMSSTAFVLTKAAQIELPDMSPTASKPVQTAAKKGAPSQFQLVGADSMLAPYVDHQVQITGTVGQAAATGKGSAKGASATSGPVNVDTVMLLANTCS